MRSISVNTVGVLSLAGLAKVHLSRAAKNVRKDAGVHLLLLYAAWMMRWLLLLSLVFSLNCEAAANVAVAEQIGGVKITISAPQGFVEPSSVSADLRHFGETITPPTNRLLALFVLDADIIRSAAGKAPEFKRYFMAQTLRKIESLSLSLRDFAKIKDIVRKQHQELFDRQKSTNQSNIDSAMHNLGQRYDNPSLSLRLGDTLALGVFDERENSISVATVTKYKVMLHGKSDEVPMAVVMTFAFAKGKTFYLYTYSTYKSDADLQWVRSASQEWVSRIAGLN